MKILLLLTLATAPLYAVGFNLFHEHINFAQPEKSTRATTTWGTEHTDTRTLDLTPEGLGFDAGIDNAFTAAWIQTAPLALGDASHPWDNVSFKITIDGRVDESGHSCIGRVFIRHSPDLKNWSSWQVLERKSQAVLRAEQEEFVRLFRQHHPSSPPINLPAGVTPPDFGAPPKPLDSSSRDESPKVVFHGTLAIPHAVHLRHQKLLADFAATKPSDPKSLEDALRWILSHDPHYLDTDPPFFGHVQFRFEAYLGKSPHRIRGITIFGTGLTH